MNNNNDSDKNIISFDELLSAFKKDGYLNDSYEVWRWTKEGLRALYSFLYSNSNFTRYLSPKIDNTDEIIDRFVDTMSACTFCSDNESKECQLAYDYAVVRTVNKYKKFGTTFSFSIIDPFFSSAHLKMDPYFLSGMLENRNTEPSNRDTEPSNRELSDEEVSELIRKHYGEINGSCLSFLKSKGLIVLPYGRDIGKKDARPENLGTVVEITDTIYPKILPPPPGTIQRVKWIKKIPRHY